MAETHVRSLACSPPPLATSARPATGREASPCQLCTRPVCAGERVADLPGGAIAHVPCIAWVASRGDL
jgi:hypothetical protein